MTLTIDLSVHPLDVVLRTAHAFTGRCHVFVRAAEAGQVTVAFEARDGCAPPPAVAGEFSDALLDHHLRALIGEETRAIRELLVAQAFCEADLLDRRDSESSEHADPRGIAR